MEANESQGAPTAEQLERLTGKIILDKEFRQTFFADPQGAAQEFDPEIMLTAEQIEVVGSLDQVEVESYIEELIEEVGRVHIAYWLAPQQEGPQGPVDLPSA